MSRTTILSCPVPASFEHVDWRRGMENLYTEIEMMETMEKRHVFHYTYPTSRLPLVILQRIGISRWFSRYTRIRNEMMISMRGDHLSFQISLIAHPSFQVHGEIRLSPEEGVIHLHIREPVLEDRMFRLLPQRIRQELVEFIYREIVRDATHMFSDQTTDVPIK